MTHRPYFGRIQDGPMPEKWKFRKKGIRDNSSSQSLTQETNFLVEFQAFEDPDVKYVKTRMKK